MAWGLLWSAQQVAYSRLGTAPISVGTGLLLQMPLAVVWALITPGIVWLGRRWSLDGPWRLRHGAAHLLVSLAVVYGLGVFYAANVEIVRGLPADAPPLLQRSLRLFIVWSLSDAVLYWAVLVLDYGVRQFRAARARELRAAQLETQLAAARLAALKVQLHPHFLFNALHTIGTLVRTGQPEPAVRVVAGLGDLLRRILDDAATQEVPLRQELDLLRAYLDIEQIRFSDRLRVEFQVEPETLDASVPHLILQPLAENALRHGIEPDAQAGRLSVTARKGDGARPGVSRRCRRDRADATHGAKGRALPGSPARTCRPVRPRQRGSAGRLDAGSPVRGAHGSRPARGGRRGRRPAGLRGEHPRGVRVHDRPSPPHGRPDVWPR
jgi:hypothetical protein